MIDKAALRAELHAVLLQALETARAAHAAAVAGATHTEARAENPKDTRGLEQSYLARGQAGRVAELELAVSEVAAMQLRAFGAGDPIASSAVVVLEDDEAGGDGRRYFIAPHGGGTALAHGIQVITPLSPLARALLGKRAGDAVEFRGRELAIASVA
jgi:transcription elongation GreA/GreB family factor